MSKYRCLKGFLRFNRYTNLGMQDVNLPPEFRVKLLKYLTIAMKLGETDALIRTESVGTFCPAANTLIPLKHIDTTTIEATALLKIFFFIKILLKLVFTNNNQFKEEKGTGF